MPSSPPQPALPRSGINVQSLLLEELFGRKEEPQGDAAARRFRQNKGYERGMMMKHLGQHNPGITKMVSLDRAALFPRQPQRLSDDLIALLQSGLGRQQGGFLRGEQK